MKYCLYSLLLLLISQSPFAQQRWTWIGGSKAANTNGQYGSLGAPSGSNNPGSRNGAATWTDAQGNFWLFGGSGNGENTSGLLNDIWRYNPSSNQWTWMGGEKTPDATGRYGIIGIPVFQQPGAREYAATWVDQQGNFWMFGGRGFATTDRAGLLSDLWKYTPATGTWAWIGGHNWLDQEGVYGNQERPDADNIPGSRYQPTTWTDNSGNLWMFGGFGFSERTNTGGLNDIWKYSISTNEWTWMNGEKRENNRGRYGNRGEFGNNTQPGGRQGATGWKDGQGHFWLYGGESGQDLHNDLWQYDIAQNRWAWMSGSENENSDPDLGEIGVPAQTNQPGGRTLSSGWVDPNGNLWLFGGRGYGRINRPLNNIWTYSIANDTWAFINGDASNDPVPVYGDRGVAAADNKPAGSSGSTAWTNEDGTFWFFGGEAADGSRNQTWRFSPCASGDITPITAKICSGGSQELTATGGSSYSWLRDNEVINGVTGPTYTATQAGTYSVIVKNGACAVPGFNTAEIELASAPTGTISPASATICQGASRELTATGGTSYEWKRNGLPLPETTAKITVTLGGTYSVIITNGSCTGPASNTSEITVEPTPAGTISPASAALCNGNAQTLTATGGTSYEWMRNGATIAGETASTISVSVPGTYSVIVKGGVCAGPAANTSEVVELSTQGVRYEDVTATENVPFQLSARVTGQSYEWLPYTGLDDPSSATPLATLSSQTVYTVTITSTEGCSIVDTQLVKVVPNTGGNTPVKGMVPTAFTPNGNNVNDKLRPLGNVARLDYFRVYNRWGVVMFETNRIGEGWDGRYKGVMQQPDTYTWILLGRRSDGQPLKLSGKTVLIR